MYHKLKTLPFSNSTQLRIVRTILSPIYIYPTLSVRLLQPFHYTVMHFYIVLKLFKVLHFTAQDIHIFLGHTSFHHGIPSEFVP